MKNNVLEEFCENKAMNVFIAHVPLHYYLFRSTYKHLANSYFIIPPMNDKPMSNDYGSGMSGKGLYDYLYQFLKEQDARIIEYGEVTKKNFIAFITEQVGTIICPHAFDGIYEIENTRIFKMAYGIPNNEGMIQFDYVENFMVDAVFTFGPESVDRFEKSGLTAVAVGNPLYDFWYSNKFDESNLELIKNKLIKDAPTILYLPTYTNYSSIDKFGDEIIELSRKYNVIVKLHHCTFNGEANRLCKFLSHPEIITLGDFFDPLVLYKLSDIVLSDVSGALFDAFLIQKPLILLSNSLIKYRVDILCHKNPGANIEESGLFPYTRNPAEVEGLIKKTLYKKKSINEELLFSLFFKRDGLVGKRIADIILNKTKYPLISTLDKYEKAIEKAPNEENRKHIVSIRDSFVSKYYPNPYKKPSLASRIYRRYF